MFDWLTRIKELNILIALLVLSAFLAIRSPIFLTTDNLLGVARVFSLTAIAAIGETMVIITGGIDLSVGSIIGLSGISTGLLLAAGWPLAPEPVPVIVMLVLTVLGTIFLSQSTVGRHVYAVGGNEEATRLAGINIDRVKLTVYAISRLLAAVSGLILVSRLVSAQPSARHEPARRRGRAQHLAEAPPPVGLTRGGLGKCARLEGGDADDNERREEQRRRFHDRRPKPIGRRPPAGR